MIIRPRRLNRGALKGFRNTLHETIPSLRNLTHEEIESIKDERNADVFDST
jgi:hypothetical protein